MKKISSEEIRKRFLDFMKSKGHTIVPSQSLLPKDDPTTLFTGSGMQPMLPYLLGEEHPAGTRVADIQKCFRAGEIEEVGDNRHTTSFEMAGNWSFGDYFRDEQIEWIFEFLTDKEKGLGLDPKKLFVTAFLGDEKNNLKKDTKAGEKWKELFARVGIEAEEREMGSASDGSKKGMKGARIFYYDSKENWWSRAGVPDNMPVGEPGGPDSEMFYDYGEFVEHNEKFGKHCHPACDCGRFVEIGNNVFMTYKKVAEGEFEELPKKNIDHGSGFERWVAAANSQNDFFKTDIFEGMIDVIEKKSGKSYDDPKYQKSFRIIIDHIKSAVLMLADGLEPSNKEAGYILRRLVRRAMVHMQKIDFPLESTAELTEAISEKYSNIYENIKIEKENIEKKLAAEIDKFSKTLKKGIKEFEKIVDPENKKNNIKKLEFGQIEVEGPAQNEITADDAFVLVTTYGLPKEIIREEAENRGLCVDCDGLEKKLKEHSKESATATAGKFKGGLGGDSPKIIAFHTATHLMLAGLQRYAGADVHQKGSNITEDRARFDFTHDGKVEREILDKVEEYVNEAIEKGIDMVQTQMDKNEAKENGVEGSFWEKYPDVVKVWTLEKDGQVYSKELCGGPHVKNTAEIAKFGKFKIKKESSSSAGVRRIKAIFE